MTCIHSREYHLGWEVGLDILEGKAVDVDLPLCSKAFRLGFQDVIHGKTYCNPWGNVSKN